MQYSSAVQRHGRREIKFYSVSTVLHEFLACFLKDVEHVRDLTNLH